MYGISEDIWIKIRNVFDEYASVSEVILYGSRAMATNRPFSDIDLSMKGSGITFTEFCEITNKLDDLLLPYQIDLSIFSELKNEKLIDHILRVGKSIYKHESTLKSAPQRGNLSIAQGNALGING